MENTQSAPLSNYADPTWQDEAALAAFRAWLQGVPSRAAVDRYLPDRRAAGASGGAVAPRPAPAASAPPVVAGAAIAVPPRPLASPTGLGSLGSACAIDLVDRHGLVGAQHCGALALLAYGLADFATRRGVGREARAFACAMLATLDSAGAVPRHVNRGALLADIEDAAVAMHSSQPEFPVQA